jgi:hypothetical protein
MGARTLAIVEQVVETTTTWQLCACEDGVHGVPDREAAKATRREAADALVFYPAGTAHLLRTAAVTHLEPLDQTLDTAQADAIEALAPYDPAEEHDYFREDEWRTA